MLRFSTFVMLFTVYMLVLVLFLINGYRRPRVARLAVRPLGILYSVMLVLAAGIAGFVFLIAASWWGVLVALLILGLAFVTFRASMLVPQRSRRAMVMFGLVALLSVVVVMASRFMTSDAEITNPLFMFVLAIPPIALAVLTYFGFRSRIEHG